MPSRRSWMTLGLAACAAVGLLATVAPAGAHDAHQQHGAAEASGQRQGGVKVRGLDAVLVNQHGREVNLQRDVVGDRIVVVNFVYTTCTTVCPLSSAILADLQSRLGPAMGKDVALVTITVDPVRDTPAVLKSYAARFQAGEAWTWLTGRTAAVNEVLKGMGAYAPDFTQHPLMVLVGDGAGGGWTRFSGTPEPQRLVDAVSELQQARLHRHHAKGG